MNVVLNRIKDKHIGNDAVARSFYDLYWFLVKLGVTTGDAVWAKDFRGRIMLSRLYVAGIESRHATKL